MRTMALMAGAALMALASPALADDWDFVLINNSGKEIKTIEVSANGANSWVANKVDAENSKANGSIKSGARVTVHFDKGPGCRYDLKATFADGSNGVWSNINVCDNAYVTIKYGAGGAPTFTAN